MSPDRSSDLQKHDASLSVGTCNEVGDSDFHCTCPSNWQGTKCEAAMNYCGNVTCLNHGVCRSSPQGYRCECLGDSYSGRGCEVTAAQLKVRQILSRFIAGVAICLLIMLVLLIIAMDILQHCFGINPTYKRPVPMQQKQIKTHSAIRFVYVHPPTDQS